MSQKILPSSEPATLYLSVTTSRWDHDELTRSYT
jgi:hypothetical protein